MLVSVIIAILLVSTVTLWSVALAFGFSVAVGIIFGMAPAIRASKLSPIDALHYE
jgi:putative ABC transport system permease protein